MTEAIQFSTKNLRTPLWYLFIDKMSAYDMCLKQHVISGALEASGGPQQADQTLIYLANRLSNRHTYLEFDSVTMGPTKDKAGVEVFGKLSTEEFQMINK